MTVTNLFELKDKGQMDKQKALESALAQIERQFGKGSIMKLDENAYINIPGISTGAISLDLALGEAAETVYSIGSPELDKHGAPSGVTLAPEGGAHQSIATPLIGMAQDGLPGLLVLWALLGLGVAWALTPATYLIRRIAAPSDLQALFTAQVTIANACLLLAYPLAGWLGASLGMGATFAIIGALAALSTAIAWLMWRG